MNSSKHIRITLIALLFALTACSGSAPSGSNGPLPAAPRAVNTKDTLGGLPLSISLTDAPPRIGNLTPSAINLGIDSVAVISNGVTTTLATYPTPYVVDVLAAQNDPSSIGIGDVFSGFYQQLQFVVDVKSSGVVANGITYPLSFMTNAGTQSSVGAGTTTQTTSVSPGAIAMTVTAPFVVDHEPANAVIADFNALESIAQQSDGSLVVRPTLFAVPTVKAGTIAGTVVNASGSPVYGATVVALHDGNRVANTVDTNSDGTFTLHTIAAGGYRLVIYNNYTTASGQQLTASGQTSTRTFVAGPHVRVRKNQTTQIGTIQD
ncbi:MAG: carboxypeptidase regulatory-like domain-containing protein [Vulcanimicrobiaceae bacterium]